MIYDDDSNTRLREHHAHLLQEIKPTDSSIDNTHTMHKDMIDHAFNTSKTAYKKKKERRSPPGIGEYFTFGQLHQFQRADHQFDHRPADIHHLQCRREIRLGKSRRGC